MDSLLLFAYSDTIAYVSASPLKLSQKLSIADTILYLLTTICNKKVFRSLFISYEYVIASGKMISLYHNGRFTLFVSIGFVKLKLLLHLRLIITLLRGVTLNWIYLMLQIFVVNEMMLQIKSQKCKKFSVMVEFQTSCFCEDVADNKFLFHCLHFTK